MANVIQNDKGFKVISLSADECKQLGWGTHEGAICTHCNKVLQPSENHYYIAVLNDIMCEKCYTEWLGWAVRYSDDAPYEDKHFNYICNLLNL